MQRVYLFFQSQFYFSYDIFRKAFRMDRFSAIHLFSSWRHDYKQDMIVWRLFRVTYFTVDNMILFPSKVLLFLFVIV